MEYLDIYDEEGNYLGQEKREIVHEKALWHNTVHAWLYDKYGNIYFQIRKEEQKLYTTASGHVKAKETIKEALGREIEEEIGIKIDYNKAEFVNIYKFTMDKVKKDNTVFRDRAFSNIYTCIFEGNYDDFNFDEDELSGLVKVNAKDTLNLFNNQTKKIKAEYITIENNKIKTYEKEITINDFVINKGETAMGKYGDVLNKVIELTENENKK